VPRKENAQKTEIITAYGDLMLWQPIAMSAGFTANYPSCDFFIHQLSVDSTMFHSKLVCRTHDVLTCLYLLMRMMGIMRTEVTLLQEILQIKCGIAINLIWFLLLIYKPPSFEGEWWCPNKTSAVCSPNQ